MLADGDLAFAGLDALVPRVIKLCVASSSAVSEPRAAATTATTFVRFTHISAFVAYGTDNRPARRDC